MQSGKKPSFIRKHEYPGGKKAFQDFIKANLVYPEVALKKKISGDVFLEYQVGFDGTVTQVKLKKGIGYGCDEEAIRLVKLLKFAPQNNHGVKLITTHKIKIHFELPKEKKSVQINYNLKTAQNKKSEEKPGSYSYTIKF